MDLTIQKKNSNKSIENIFKAFAFNHRGKN